MKLERLQKKWQMIYADVISGRVMNGITEEDRNGWVELHESSRILKMGFLSIFQREMDISIFIWKGLTDALPFR